MDLIKQKVYDLQEFYDWAFSVADQRVADWPLMSGYTPTLSIASLYLLAVYIGQKVMETRQPIKLNSILVIYNFSCVLINLYACTELFICSWKLGYSYTCQPVSYTYDPYEMRIAKILWLYYVSKCVEMLDTIFFILRKKNSQVSFLHVYHHASVFTISYIGIKWAAGGQFFFGSMINSFIHVIMYTYYGISAMGPKYQKFLWWKRYLTGLQLAVLIPNRCDFPEWMQWVLICYALTIMLLFLNFYFHAYLKSQKSTAVLIPNRCDFPEWMQWVLICYALTIMLLFLNFYFHAYLKSQKSTSGKAESNGTVTSKHITNGTSPVSEKPQVGDQNHETKKLK